MFQVNQQRQTEIRYLSVRPRLFPELLCWFVDTVFPGSY